jgi:hypothetical protein
LPLGNYSVKIPANGMADWTAPNVPASAMPEANPSLAILQVAPEVTAITVGLPGEEVAAEQINVQLKQRVLGVVPNYYVRYESHPARISANACDPSGPLSVRAGLAEYISWLELGSRAFSIGLANYGMPVRSANDFRLI